MESYFEEGQKWIAQKWTQQIWIFLTKSFQYVVSDLSQPFQFVQEFIFCVRLLGV